MLKKRGCITMVRQQFKPSSSMVMRGLGNEIITLNNINICHSNSINRQKYLKHKEQPTSKKEHLIISRFSCLEFIILKERDNKIRHFIISQNREKGGF